MTETFYLLLDRGVRLRLKIDEIALQFGDPSIPPLVLMVRVFQTFLKLSLNIGDFTVQFRLIRFEFEFGMVRASNILKLRNLGRDSLMELSHLLLTC